MGSKVLPQTPVEQSNLHEAPALLNPSSAYPADTSYDHMTPEETLAARKRKYAGEMLKYTKSMAPERRGSTDTDSSVEIN